MGCRGRGNLSPPRLCQTRKMFSIIFNKMESDLQFDPGVFLRGLQNIERSCSFALEATPRAEARTVKMIPGFLTGPKKIRLEGVSQEKAHCIEYGRFAREDAYKRGGKPKESKSLDFTHHCGKTEKGYFKVKRRTSRTKMTQSLHSLSDRTRGASSQLEFYNNGRARP